MVKTTQRDEIARLRALVMELAERVYIMSRHLSVLAERKDKRRA